jgi:hypothetical protein
MNIEKVNENTLLANYADDFEELNDFIKLLIDVFSAARLSRDNWLTEREKDFFTALVVSYHSGIKNHIDQGSDDIYNKFFGSHKKKERSIWLNNLQKKKWVTYNRDGFDINPFFKVTNLMEDANVVINLDFTYKS